MAANHSRTLVLFNLDINFQKVDSVPELQAGRLQVLVRGLILPIAYPPQQPSFLRPGRPVGHRSNRTDILIL